MSPWLLNYLNSVITEWITNWSMTLDYVLDCSLAVANFSRALLLYIYYIYIIKQKFFKVTFLESCNDLPSRKVLGLLQPASLFFISSFLQSPLWESPCPVMLMLVSLQNHLFCMNSLQSVLFPLSYWSSLPRWLCLHSV